MIYNDIIFSDSLKNAEIEFFNEYNASSRVLMENASNALFSVLFEYIREDSKICFVCGSGNNGGDGYACACLLSELGYDVLVVCNKPAKTEDCLYFYNKYLSLGGAVFDFSQDDNAIDAILDSDVVVDCLYGIGFKGALNEIDNSIVNVINDSDSFVISCDVPSGTVADTACAENAVCADITVVFTALKASNVSYPALEYNGRIVLKDIGIPKEILDKLDADDIIVVSNENNNIVPLRAVNSHKGTFGTLVMYCGSENMIGAAVFSAKAAIRSGVGLIKICSKREALNKIQSILGDPVFCEISEHAEKGDAYVIGCGISRSMDDILENILSSIDKPVVIDADGINFISNHIDVLKNMTAKKILTPHPAEMARLLGLSISEVNSNRLSIARKFAQDYDCVLVLKGNRTIIASPDRLAVNMSGSHSLAKGGSGDMLAGMIGAYLALGLDPFDAARLGCFQHGKLGEMSSFQDSISEMIEKIQ